ncbi:MAG: pyrroline-5-carboxylate reductase [Chitinispirillaceae bacterium]|nr:pyrroline-5-carboxylate reductase [Chitinispirillaceae bacterium]
MNIAVLGTGNMGKALIAGLCRKYGSSIQIVAWDKNHDAMKTIDPSVIVTEPQEWFAVKNLPEAVILAVKPFDVEVALAPLLNNDPARLKSALWISIAAGKSIAALEKLLPEGCRICRVMPNTPALIDEAMSVYTMSANTNEADARVADKIFHACGKTIQVPEKFMNAVTGLSGTGPAYVFYFLESLIEAGVVAGLPQRIARECALQTVIGAAKMAEASIESLNDLKMKVMTPAGTTASAFTVLEQHGFKHAVIKAVVSATDRSEKLEALR